MVKKRDLARERYEAVCERIAMWSARERRAINALRKLYTAKTNYERRRPDLVRTVLLQQLQDSTLGYVATVAANEGKSRTRRK